MLTVKFSHTQYQNFVESLLDKFFIQTYQQITLLNRSSLITKMWSTDLTKIVPLIQNTYSKSTQGAPPKDAVALFKSLIIMSYSNETSISAWVKALQSEPFYVILSGFVPICYSSAKAKGILADSIPGDGIALMSNIFIDIPSMVLLLVIAFTAYLSILNLLVLHATILLLAFMHLKNLLIYILKSTLILQPLILHMLLMLFIFYACIME